MICCRLITTCYISSQDDGFSWQEASSIFLSFQPAALALAVLLAYFPLVFFYLLGREMSCFCLGYLGYNSLDRLFVIFKFAHIDVSMLKLTKSF